MCVCVCVCVCVCAAHAKPNIRGKAGCGHVLLRVLQRVLLRVLRVLPCLQRVKAQQLHL